MIQVVVHGLHELRSGQRRRPPPVRGAARTDLGGDVQALAVGVQGLANQPVHQVRPVVVAGVQVRDPGLDARSLHLAADLAYARFGFHATAYLWLTVAPGLLTATGEALSRHPETTFAAAVTGSANLLVTVTCRTMDDLYAYVTTKIGVLPAVTQVDVVPVLHRLEQAGTRVHDGRLTAA